MEEVEGNRPDAGGSEVRPDAQTDDPFARWSAARARVRAALGGAGGAPEQAATGDAETIARLQQELAQERQRRASAERAAEKLAAVLERERRQRVGAEELADAVVAELELATQSTHGVTSQNRRRRRVRRALRRFGGPR